MRVYIGPYVKHYSTYELERKWISFSHRKDYYDVEEEDFTRLDRIVIKVLDFCNTCFLKPINNLNSWRGRKIKIKLHDYDTWSMDYTLALIILPMLKQLKETKHGSPHTDPEDVPEHLRPDPNRIKMKENGELQTWEVDNTVHERWDWILDEIIWAFEKLNGEDPDHVYDSTGEKLDMVETEKQSKRMENALTLFGKYYRGLWD
jgi:hypothetical protein